MKIGIPNSLFVFCIAIALLFGGSIPEHSFNSKVSWLDFFVVIGFFFVVPIVWSGVRFGVDAIAESFPKSWKIKKMDHTPNFMDSLMPFLFMAFGVAYLLRQMVSSHEDWLRGVTLIVGSVMYLVGQKCGQAIFKSKKTTEPVSLVN